MLGCCVWEHGAVVALGACVGEQVPPPLPTASIYPQDPGQEYWELLAEMQSKVEERGRTVPAPCSFVKPWAWAASLQLHLCNCIPATVPVRAAVPRGAKASGVWCLSITLV